MNRYSLYITLFFLSILASCVSKKPVANTTSYGTDEELTMEIAALLRKVEASQVEYLWFSGSGQGKIDWDGQRMSARINVRILRDSIIWVQVQKFGFEVGRMLITHDSAYIINRLERTYSLYRTIDFLEEYKVPADFDMFSRVFTAGAYMPPMIDTFMVGQDGSVMAESGNGMSARLWFDTSSLLIRSLITDQFAREWSSVYADYKQTNSGQHLPYTRLNTIVIDGKPNIFDLEYSEMEIDVPLSFPFSIPSHYEKI